MSRAYKTVTPEEIKATAVTWAHLAKHTDWTAPKVGLALLADRDRLAAELARVRRNHLRRMIDVAHAWGILSSYSPSSYPLPGDRIARLARFVTRIRAALAQPQDGTTEVAR